MSLHFGCQTPVPAVNNGTTRLSLSLLTSAILPIFLTHLCHGVLAQLGYEFLGKLVAAAVVAVAPSGMTR